jgi:hypothetical protein
VDVRVVFGVESFELRMQGFVAGTGQAGIAFVNLDVRVSSCQKLTTYLRYVDMLESL